MSSNDVGFILGHLLGTLVFVLAAHLYFKWKDGEGLF